MPLSENERLILVIVLAVLMTFIIFFELRVMRNKSKEKLAAGQKKDEAFNSVLTTRTVMNTVKNRGGRVGEAPVLLDKAKEAMNRGRYDSCVDYCERARAELTAPSSKSSATAGAGDADARSSLEAVAESIVSSRADRDEPDSYKGTKLEAPKEGNYLGARFEISAAKADVGRASDSGIETSVSEGMIVEAEAAYTAGNYDKALSLAVRARKAINQQVAGESIPLKDKDQPTTVPPAKVFDVEARKLKVAKGKQCKECGAFLDKEDAFCPICGEKVGQSSCPQCGAVPRSGDKFCRKCGARFE